MFRDVARRVPSPILLLALALLVACPTATHGGAPPSAIDVKPQYKPYEPIIARVNDQATLYFWDFDEDVLGVRELDEGRTLHIWAPPGTHRLKCMLVTIDWENKTARKTTVRATFAVGKPNPPDPPDPPDPPPNTKWQVCFFRESSTMEELSQAQRTIVSSQVLRGELEKRGHKFVGSFDRDSLGRQNKIPARLAAWWEAVKGDTMPRVAIAPLGGGTVKDYPLPADRAALWKLLEKGEP